MLSFKAHRTHPRLAAMISTLRLVAQLTALTQWDSIRWDELWARRFRARSGPLAQSWHHFRYTSVTWDTPLEVAHRSPGKTLTCKVELHINKSQQAAYWHDVRELLRTALWNKIAIDRPKDFSGLEDGIGFRETIQSMFHTKGAPSVLCGGMWTMMNAYLANLSDESICPRCFLEPETTEHRLWECPCGKQERDELLETLPGLDYTQLPNCLRRCGLPPANFHEQLELSPLPILHYLIKQNLCATAAFLDVKRLQQLTSQGGACAGHRSAPGILGILTTGSASRPPDGSRH